jgi:hypothetical protein
MIGKHGVPQQQHIFEMEFSAEQQADPLHGVELRFYVLGL